MSFVTIIYGPGSQVESERVREELKDVVIGEPDEDALDRVLEEVRANRRNHENDRQVLRSRT